MATLHPPRTGGELPLPLPLYIGPDEVYGTKLPHNVPRVKIQTQFGPIPFTIPQSDNEIPEIPESVKNREIYEKKIPRKVFREIQNYIFKHRVPLSSFYYQKISEKEMKQQIGYK